MTPKSDKIVREHNMEREIFHKKKKLNTRPRKETTQQALVSHGENFTQTKDNYLVITHFMETTIFH